MWLSRTGKRWISVFVCKWSVFQNTVTNDEGVILTTEAVIDSHVPDAEVESHSSSHSAMQGEHVLRSPSTEPSGLEATVSELRLALESEKQSNE